MDVGENMKLKECEQLWLAEKESITQNLPDLLGNSHKYVMCLKYISVMIGLHKEFNGLIHRNPLIHFTREICLQEAQYLAAVLASNETPLILGTLKVVANLAVFSSNQDKFREAGIIAILPKLVLHSSRQIKQKSCLVAANMAMNEKNNNGIYINFNFVLCAKAN